MTTLEEALTELVTTLDEALTELVTTLDEALAELENLKRMLEVIRRERRVALD